MSLNIVKFNKQKKLKKRIKQMTQALDNLTAEVTQATTVMDSAVTLIGGLAAEVAAIKAELASQGVTNAALDDLAVKLDTSEQALAAAIVANTPAA